MTEARGQSEQQTQAAGVRGIVVRLLLATVGMFGFGFALVPLYDLICDVTGLGGRTGGQYDYVEADLSEDRSRLVTVRFVTNNNADMPWEFRAGKGGMRVHPGGMNEAVFFARNPTDRPMMAQAVPSVAPAMASEFFHKTECFCFDQQVLQPGEAIEMPLRFIVDRDLPDSVNTISLSYTMFDITDYMPASGETTAAGG